VADSYRIMQVTETGEAFCVEDGLTMEEADDWIQSNAGDFPESTFRREKVIDDPYYSDEPEELNFDGY